MFKEHGCIVWGTRCMCSAEVSILQNGHHPWVDKGFIVQASCPACGREVLIGQDAASQFYSQRIFHHYRGVAGTVMDLGCGSGFLTAYLAENPEIRRIHAVDPEAGCREHITAIPDPGDKIRFHCLSAGEIGEKFNPDSFDYLVHRDVFMFISDPGRYLDDVTRIVKRGIRHMGWYMAGNERMNNTCTPDAIAAGLDARGWTVELEPLDWYKCGYFIRADKTSKG